MLPRSLFAFLLLAALVFPCRADQPIRKVTVTGMCTLHVVPDEMKWSVQVSINDSTLAKAKARHDESLDAALKFIKGLGSAVQDLQTGGIRIDKQTYFQTDTDRSKPFSCSTQFTFTLTDFNQYGAICDGLAKFDGIQVQGVDYATSKEDETREQALKNALLNAHNKASDLAVTANCYIDRPLEIIEGGGDSPRPMMMDAVMARSAGGTPAAVPGQIEISASVTATYDLFYK